MGQHSIRLSDKGGGDAMYRLYEQEVSTDAEVYELVTHLCAELKKAKRENRSLVVEVWTDYLSTSAFVPKRSPP